MEIQKNQNDAIIINPQKTIIKPQKKRDIKWLLQRMGAILFLSTFLMIFTNPYSLNSSFEIIKIEYATISLSNIIHVILFLVCSSIFYYIVIYLYFRSKNTKKLFYWILFLTGLTSTIYAFYSILTKGN
ncbi:hypothetical protein PY093_20580 [Cytobacillus sp. S13-E01]|uniref:hypothetical protein n=1 Tax=Cytobacillus sp. S13-E01 TaxID=3031326 RepID=UPI0023D8A138|nr:hypothetical protein [Cytobacillus sp. S13-E01]MDF0729008.1 hypothetical protein [Cytobacillus sp. S13-E01]